ncbi:MAG: helix-turn-helix transcriptional regulator [Myxococcales bacterium]|nr:helix-turn-helix transcriptional regulator [Myxococcales bacterium]
MRALNPAADLESFARQPSASYTAGSGWMHFCATPELFGVLLWGRPDAEAITHLVRSLRVELRPDIVPHASLVDASRLDSADGAAFVELAQYVRDEKQRLSAKVTRLALVRAEGYTGAVISGFFSVLDAPYPVALFDDPRQALGWLERDAAWADAFAEAYQQLAGEAPIVTALGRALVASAGGLSATIAEAARLLGTSQRTLQRRLKEAGTSYQRELARVRVSEAKRRMRTSSAPLTNIALDLGFASLQAFSALFRREVGQSPSAWRRDNAE